MSTTAIAAAHPVGEPAVPHADEVKIERILLATAGEPSSKGALVAARTIAARSGARVNVVTVFHPRIPYPPPREGGFPAIPYSDRDPARRQLELVRQQLGTRGSEMSDWPLALVAGQPAHNINKLARDQHANLVVIGMGRENPVERGIGDRGSMSIAATVPCPLLAATADFDGDVQDVMIAVGIDDTALAAFAIAQELFPAPQRLHLVHVAETPLEAAEQMRQRQVAAIRGALSAWRSATVESWLLTGEPIDQLLSFAQEHDIDLVVGGMHGNSFAERAIMRNAALWLMAIGDRSVLLVPKPA